MRRTELEPPIGLHGARWSNQPLDERAARSLIDGLIDLAKDARSSGAERLRSQAEAMVNSSSLERRIAGQELRHRAGVMERSSTLELIFAADRERFQSEETFAELVRLFREAVKARGDGEATGLDRRRLEPMLERAQQQQ